MRNQYSIHFLGIFKMDKVSIAKQNNSDKLSTECVENQRPVARPRMPCRFYTPQITTFKDGM